LRPEIISIMKKIVLVAVVFVSTAVVFGQQEKVATKKVVKKEVKKEVRMELVDGEKTLTIKTEGDGVTKTQVYKGEQATEKMAELEGVAGAEEEMNEKKEVRLEEIDGKKKLTVTTTRGSKVEEEVFVGEEADKKIEELGLGEKEKEEKVYIKKKRVEEKVNH
jgi:hypothetical protein